MSEEHPINEKVRLIRWRMAKERLRFADELRLIPRWLIRLVVLLFVAAQVVAQIINAHEGHPHLPALALAGAVTAVSIAVASVLFLIAYVNRDAERRGMNSTLWTLLVIILLPGYLALGFIIYFLLREPLPFKCPQCGATVSARFNFCPSCKFNLRPTCRQCKREVRIGDHYCPHCAYELAGVGAA